MWLEITRKAAGWALGAAIGLSAPAGADEWDVGADADNGNGTDNRLLHGSEQVHDMRILPGLLPDQDWYLVQVQPLSSYEFVVDGLTGDLDFTPTSVQRITPTATENAVLSPAGGVLSLNWLRGAVTTAETNFVRVQGAACGTACNQRDTYRARFFDTTYTVPRFNNSGTQSTTLLIQNTTNRTCIVSFFLMSVTGSLIAATSAGPVAPNALVVFPTAVTAPNQSGSIRIAHACGYGGLSAKAVSLEPATGFTFDTPVLHRPH